MIGKQIDTGIEYLRFSATAHLVRVDPTNNALHGSDGNSCHGP